MTEAAEETVAATIMVAIDKNYSAKIATPPKGHLDNFEERSQDCGKLDKVTNVICSPKGEMFCIRGGDMYVGPLPSSRIPDWFSGAKRVGRHEWRRAEIVFFHPKGDLYAITKEGDLYKGPKPDNEYVSWFYERASLVSKGGWNHLLAAFFDSEDSLYAVARCNDFLKGPVPEAGADWFKASKKIGQYFWKRFAFFISITPDGKLWCIDEKYGNLLRGNPPKSLYDDYLDYAEHLAKGFEKYKYLTFCKDKTIQCIIHVTFLPELAKKTNEKMEVLTEETYDNRGSTVPLTQTFEVSKRMMETSVFGDEHGFEVGVGVSATFTAKIPIIGESSTTVALSTTTSHTWNFETTNEVEHTFTRSSEVNVPAGQAIKKTASVTSCTLDIPYKAKIRTMYGCETTIEGMWRGVLYSHLTVTQTDI